MPPRHVRSYSDFYRHGRRVSPVAIKKNKPKLRKVRQSSDTAILSVSRKRSKSSVTGINWRSIKRWIVAIIVIGWIATPLYAPYFRVKNITFENFPTDLQMNARTLIHDSIKPSFIVIPNNNYFIINTEAVKTVLTDNFSTVENIKITKKFPDQLVISASEKTPAIVYDDGKNYYTLDSEGNILHQIAKVGDDEFTSINESPSNFLSSSSTTSTITDVTEEPLSLEQIHTPNYKKIATQFGLLPLVYDTRKNIIIGSQTVLPSSTILAVINWQKWLLESKLVSPHYYTLSNLNSSIEVHVDKSWVIDFRPNDVLQTQFDNFRTIVLDAVKNKKKIVDHIDVSFARPESKINYVK